MKNSIILLFSILLILSCGNSRNEEKVDGNEQRDILEEVLTLSLDANELTQTPNGDLVFELSNEVEDEIRNKLRKSIELGKSLNPKFLKFIEGDLPWQFNNNLIAGMEKYLRGLEDEDINLQLDGNKLIMNWAQYWQRNKDDILNKMYPGN